MDSEYWKDRFVEHLRASGRSESTVASYLVETKRFLSFLADRGLSEPHQIQKVDVEEYQLSLEHRIKANGEPLTLSGKTTKIYTVKSFLKFLRQAEVLLTDPARDIVCKPPPRKLLPELPTEAEVLSLLEVPDVTTPLGLRDRAILELLYSSGLRNSELRMLKVSDVDLLRLQVRVELGKGRRHRMIPLGEEAGAWIGEYLQSARAFLLRKKEHGFLFVSFHGNRFHVSSLAKLVSRLARAAGIEKTVTPHILRHCCATHLLRNKMNLRHLQELLGHASPSSTQVYTQVDMSDLKRAHQAHHPRACGQRVLDE